MSASYLYIGNDSTIELLLTDQDDVPVTDAVVTLETLVDQLGVAVAGIVLPVTLNHDAGGLYKATIPESVVVQRKSVYEGKVRAVSGGLQNEWTEVMRARVRRG